MDLARPAAQSLHIPGAPPCIRSLSTRQPCWNISRPPTSACTTTWSRCAAALASWCHHEASAAAQRDQVVVQALVGGLLMFQHGYLVDSERMHGGAPGM